MTKRVAAEHVRVERKGPVPLRRPWNFERDPLRVKRVLVELDITLDDIAFRSGKKYGLVAAVLSGRDTSWYVEEAVSQLIEERRRGVPPEIRHPRPELRLISRCVGCGATGVLSEEPTIDLPPCDTCGNVVIVRRSAPPKGG